jgi:hypothetical protein
MSLHISTADKYLIAASILLILKEPIFYQVLSYGQNYDGIETPPHFDQMLYYANWVPFYIGCLFFVVGMSVVLAPVLTTYRTK